MIAAMARITPNRKAEIKIMEFLSNAPQKIVFNDGFEMRITRLIFEIGSFKMASAS